MQYAQKDLNVKPEDEDWKEYKPGETSIKLSKNGNVYVRLVSELAGAGKYATNNVTNIDTDLPTAGEEGITTTETDSQITASLIVNDTGGSGIAKVEWSYSIAEQNDWKTAEENSYKAVHSETTETGENTQTAKVTIPNLQAGIEYDIKAVIWDVAGNTTEVIQKNVKTIEILTENITVEPNSVEIAEGNEIKLTAKLTPENVTNKNVTWTSEDNEKATVTKNADGTATVKALKEGSVNIIAKAEDKTAKTATCSITITKANYSITNEGQKTYYTTFNKAYEASVNKGGEAGGGTIVVEKDVTEELTEEFEINKTITINLQLNTMQINKAINLTGGTLTVTGQDSNEKTGTIKQIGTDTILFRLFNNANITVTGKPLLEAPSNVIFSLGEGNTVYDGTNGSTGNINIQGGYMVSTGRSAISLSGSGPVTINNATIFVFRNDKNGLVVNKESTSNITIDGDSIIANGTIDAGGVCGAISFSGDGTLTIKGNTIVTAGLCGTNAVIYYKGPKLQILDNASLYAGMDIPHDTVQFNRNKSNTGTMDITINTKGKVYALLPDEPLGGGVLRDCKAGNTATISILAGTFGVGSTRGIDNIKQYIESEELIVQDNQTVEFPYLEDYKTLKYVPKSDLCVLNVGK